MKRILTILFAGMLLAVWCGIATADVAMGNLSVSVNLLGSCTVTETAVMDFGDYIAGPLSQDVTQETVITVNCANGLDYSIGLDGGTFGEEEMHIRYFAVPNGVPGLEYNLYMDSLYEDVWWNDSPSRMVEDTGTGSNVNYTIYGLIPGGQQNPLFGGHVDDVNIVVTY